MPTHYPEEFLRTGGLSQEYFRYLNGKLADYLAKQKVLNPLTRRGRNDSKLILEDRLLLTLYYLRRYPTLINLGAVFGISESYCHKVYALSKTRKRTTQEKKRHTINAQVLICLLTLTILPVVAGKGRQHDFSVFKGSCLLLHPDALLLADSGYQGMHKLHQNSALPIKKKKGSHFRQKTKPIIRHYQNSVFSLSISTADARFSGLSKMLSGQAQELLADMAFSGGSC